MKWRWTGKTAAVARADLLLALVTIAGMAAPGPHASLPDIEARAKAAGLATAWRADALVIGNSGAAALTLGHRVAELEVNDARDQARWSSLLNAEVIAVARVIQAHRPKLGRTFKLGVRVSPPAAAKLRDHAERQGVSEAAALDILLLALP